MTDDARSQGSQATDAWRTIPVEGPIADALSQRRAWLEALAAGRPAARRQALDDLADDGRTEDRIRQSYTGRAAIELLQNAHDAISEGGASGQVHFMLTPTALLVSNQGAPFDATRVRSITRLGSSGKTRAGGAHHQIGYKGIGFTSVFEVSDQPQVLSRDVGFCFDRAAAATLVKEHLGDGLDGPVPARYFPLAIGPDALLEDERQVRALLESGSATVIRLPLRPGLKVADLAASLRETLTAGTLLFMPAIKTLKLDLPDGERMGWTRHVGSRTGAGRLIHLDSDDGDRESWLLAVGRVPVAPSMVQALDDPLWRGVKDLATAVAIPWSARGPRAQLTGAKLHSYFPTDDALGRSIILHADYVLDSSRRRLELKGAGGAVTRTAAEGVASLAAGLIESVATWGGAILRTCLPVERPDEAGEVVGEALERALRERRIARSTHGGLFTPGELVRLDLDLDVARERLLARCLDPSADVLEPSDDRGEVRALLTRLGARALAPTEVAKRLNLSHSTEPYSATLALAADWLDATGTQKGQVVPLLAARPVVQDEHERWTTPTRVERRTVDAPVLPPRLSRPLVREPAGESAARFVDALGITRLDARTAFGRLLTALEQKRFGLDETELAASLDLAFRVWTSHPTIVRDEQARAGLIGVPRRTTWARVERTWGPAHETYFGADWLGDRTLEQLYAPLGSAEFLGEAPPMRGVDAKRRAAFFEALGVAARPRRLSINYSTAPSYHRWQGSDRSGGWDCPNGHPYSGRRIDGWVMDRLDAILDRVDDPETASALARGLVSLGEPYGPDVLISCTNTGHAGRPTARRIEGYQRWRLQQIPWVPVVNDPAGAVLQRPGRAWRGVPRNSRWLVIPRARLRADDAEALGLVSAEKPGTIAVEEALDGLADAHPDLAAAPVEVRDTADWLLRRLERVLVRNDVRRPGRRLPALTPGGPVWSKSAVVPSVAGLPRIEGIDLLPAGQWPGIQRVYGLRSARDIASASIESGRRVTDGDPLLPTVMRAHLLALLLRQGVDPETTAARLASLGERRVSWLRVAWSVGNLLVQTPDARFVLDIRRDKLARPIGADIVWTPDARPDAIELARAIAEHIGLPDMDAEIGLFLSSPRRLVEQRGITESELGDAERMLRSRRRFVDTTTTTSGESRGQEDTLAEDDRLDSSGWEPPPSSAPTHISPPVPEKAYVDPSSVAFGAPHRLEAPSAPPAKRDGSTERASSPTPANLDRPLGAPSKEQAAATATGRRTEQTAVAIVARFGRGLPDVVEVFDVQDDNKGWDLEFLMRDGARVPVEVKGSSGSGPFVITSNELKAAKEHPSYVLYHVVDLTTPSKTRMRVFRNLRTRLTEELVSAAGWAVTGWRTLEPDEIPVTSTSDDGVGRDGQLASMELGAASGDMT